MSEDVQIRFADGERVSKEWLDGNTDEGQARLAAHRGSYPVCLCRPEEMLPLYIAKKQHFYLARMPGSGAKHSPSCPFFEPPEAWTGRSVYRAGAIDEEDTGGVRVKLADGVGVVGASTASASAPADPSPVVEGKPKKRGKLKLRGLLHLLWEEAGFNRWSPRMENKRNYYVLAKYLGQAMDRVELKGESLREFVYMPEPFVREEADAIEQRTQRRLYRLLMDRGGRRKRMLCVGLVKRIDEDDGGGLVRLAHAPAGLNLWLDDRVLAKFQAKRFPQLEDPAELLGEDRHLVVAMLIEREEASGVNVITKIDGMWVDKRLLPFEHDMELRLLDHLVEDKRHFQRALRYDAGRDEVYPDVLLLDAGEAPLPMFVYGHRAEGRRDEETRVRVQTYQDDDVEHWFWDIAFSPQDIPALPKREATTTGH